MTSAVEVMAEEIAVSHGYISLMDMPKNRREAYHERARSVLNKVDAAGFVVVPKEVAEVLKITRDQWNEKQDKIAFDALGLAIDAMILAARSTP